MRPEERDVALLWDMKEAAAEVLDFVKGIGFEQFASDKKVRYAVERQLIVLGEAASRLSAKFKEAHPEIPWSSIVGQRNVLAHEYGEVLVERVWRVAAERLPELLRVLHALVPAAPDDET